MRKLVESHASPRSDTLGSLHDVLAGRVRTTNPERHNAPWHSPVGEPETESCAWRGLSKVCCKREVAAVADEEATEVREREIVAVHKHLRFVGELGERERDKACTRGVAWSE